MGLIDTSRHACGLWCLLCLLRLHVLLMMDMHMGLGRHTSHMHGGWRRSRRAAVPPRIETDRRCVRAMP